jgi:hypothetical protein
VARCWWLAGSSFDCEVLVTGGATGHSATHTVASAELYDQSTGTWTPTRDIRTPRSGHTATPVSNGKVLVVDGGSINGVLSSAGLYDPSTEMWSLTGNITTTRLGHTATLLPTDPQVQLSVCRPRTHRPTPTSRWS